MLDKSSASESPENAVEERIVPQATDLLQSNLDRKPIIDSMIIARSTHEKPAPPQPAPPEDHGVVLKLSGTCVFFHII